MIVLPFFGVTKNAEAQKYTGSAGYSGGYGNGGGGIQGYVKGLLPATLAMPQCVAIVKNKGKKALTSLFTFLQTNKYVSNTLHQVGNWGLGKVQKVVKKKGGNAAGEVVGLVSINPVPVHDEANNTEAKKQSDTLKEIARDNGTLVEAQTCYNAIGRAAAKLMLQAITVQTVNWINNGNDGKPLFLTDTKQFFNNMAKTQILQFGSEIKSPFGKAFLQAQANSLKTHFAQNAQYSLNDMIIHTTPYASDVKFSKSFSMGGWNAWNYLTQVPANNPLGFNMIASQELNKRLAGIDVSPGQQLRDDLNTAGGYLGVTRCADPKNLTKESSDINFC